MATRGRLAHQRRESRNLDRVASAYPLFSRATNTIVAKLSPSAPVLVEKHRRTGAVLSKIPWQRDTTTITPGRPLPGQSSCSFALTPGTPCKNPSPRDCIVHSLERAPRSARFRVRVRTSVCVSPGQVNVLSLTAKRDRETERDASRKDGCGEWRGETAGRWEGGLNPPDTLLPPFPPSMNALLPQRRCVEPSRGKGCTLGLKPPCTVARVRLHFADPRATLPRALFHWDASAQGRVYPFPIEGFVFLDSSRLLMPALH